MSNTDWPIRRTAPKSTLIHLERKILKTKDVVASSSSFFSIKKTDHLLRVTKGLYRVLVVRHSLSYPVDTRGTYREYQSISRNTAYTQTKRLEYNTTKEQRILIICYKSYNLKLVLVVKMNRTRKIRGI